MLRSIVMMILLVSPMIEAGAIDESPKAEAIDFVRDVRPILARNCVACHGPEKQKAGLRLDRKKDAMAGGDSGPALLAGKPMESDLIARVSATDPEKVMPPKGDRLGEKDVKTLRDWIAQGAGWPEGVDNDSKAASLSHWAFQAPRRLDPPRVKNSEWVRNPIDAWILSRLEKEGVEPASEASRSTLIRRLSLDLIGLPPTPEEVSNFDEDPEPDAYEKVVDRLLASPHFGERWARHWLDLARYADSDGYEKDSPRPWAWRYRDWLIDALNRDLPYDQFTIDQLAGDLVPDASIDQKIATGFHRNTLTNREGGVDPEEFRDAAVIDRTNTTSTVWLGLTMGCAQCHTHKYDPILHREYYGLFAFFNTGREIDLPAPRAGESKAFATARAAFDAEHERIRAPRDAYDRDVRPSRQADWEKSAAETAPRWTILEPREAHSARGSSLEIQKDGSILATGANPDSDTYTIVVETDLRAITGFRIEALNDRRLPAQGPGRTGHGNFVLSEFAVTASRNEEELVIPLRAASADFSQDEWAVSGAIDGKAETGWAISPRMGKRHLAVFEAAGDSPVNPGRLTFRLDQNYGSQHTLGRFRISATTSAPPIRADAMPDDVVAILTKNPTSRTEAEKARLTEQHRRIDPEYQRLNIPVAEHAAKAPKPPETKAQTLAEEPGGRRTFLHVRGDFRRLGEEIRPGTPGALPPLKTAGTEPNRLDLARWIVDPANPLTSRVAVNRTWHHLFGRPIVASVDDFGTRGDTPTHPELLDWLATEFLARGWSHKALIRLMVTSATYRQASTNRPELVDRDPNNLWLARQARFRPEAEVVRDLALAASGLLSPTIGGPSVRPPQPAGISELTYAGSARWVESVGADRYRRGLYTFFQRTSPYPMLMTFDAPDSNVCSARRERSNTPLQALTLLNDTVFVDCARGLARRVLLDEGGCGCSSCRAEFAFRVCLARDPTDREARVLNDLFQSARNDSARDPLTASKLVGSDPLPKVDPADQAAWVVVARTLMNLDEFVTRE